MKNIKWIYFFLLLLSTNVTYAQFQLDGQILQRAEYRNGYGRLLEAEDEAAAFIAHRVRLQASYELENLKIYASIQDVRTWGSTQQANVTDPFLSLHEGWVEAELSDSWKLKLGRQELNYDNFRFLGNLDWALQGRSHDFILFKHEKEESKLHFGGGFNQSEQRLSSTTFTLSNQYKTAQFIRYENKIGEQWSFSLLFWNDGRENIGKHYYRQTLGIPTLKYMKGNTTVSGYYYHQLGKNTQGNTLNAFNASLQVKKLFKLSKEESEDKQAKTLQLVAGLEVISGTDGNQNDRGNSYSPLYGTNHLFNGYSDLFFIGGAFENNVGLQDYYLKARYTFSKNLFIQLDAHQFSAYAQPFNTAGDEISSSLGSELDLSMGLVINKSLSLQGGYSQVWSKNTFNQLSGLNNPKSAQNWAYVMFVVRPTMKNKFIGILL